MMNWEDAQGALQRGHIVARKCWKNGQCLKRIGNEICSFRPSKKSNRWFSWLVSQEDRERYQHAEDWMVLQ